MRSVQVHGPVLLTKRKLFTLWLAATAGLYCIRRSMLYLTLLKGVYSQFTLVARWSVVRQVFPDPAELNYCTGIHTM